MEERSIFYDCETCKMKEICKYREIFESVERDMIGYELLQRFPEEVNVEIHLKCGCSWMEGE